MPLNANALGAATRIVGWYHSHPRITVLPSHVDTRTQCQYQMMVRAAFVCWLLPFSAVLAQDNCFVGLIFACYLKHRSQVGVAAA